MRHVFGSMHECAHIYANQGPGQEYGSAGNFSFRGRVAYSYGSYQIAGIADATRQRMLIQADRYSSSTGQHIRAVRRAASHWDTITVPDVAPWETYHGHANNVQWFARQYTKAMEAGTRQLFYTGSLQRAAAVLEDFRTYVRWFRIASALRGTARKIYKAADVAPAMAAKVAEIAARNARLDTPEHKARAAAAYERKHAAQLAALHARLAEHAAEIERWNAEAAAGTWKVEYNAGVEAWRRHERSYLPQLPRAPYFYVSDRALRNDMWTSNSQLPAPVELEVPAGAGTLLRLNAEGSRIETSRSAQVTVAHARALWRIVDSSHTHGTTITDCTLEVDNFRVTRVDCGNLTIGCHYIEYDEMQRIAAALGWTILAAELAQGGAE